VALRNLARSHGVLLARLRNPRTRVGRGCSISPRAIFSPGGPITIGENSRIEHGVLLMPSDIEGSYIEIGAHSSIHAYSVVAGTGGVRIGDRVRIASHTIIASHNHCCDRVDIPIMDQGLELAPVHIEDDVWIAARATILPGVRVGTGAVIAAGAIVTKDVPPRAVVGGVPARVLYIRGVGDQARTSRPGWRLVRPPSWVEPEAPGCQTAD
jgi:acetyltransferase-like isoleucine patch superfamily enzyme